MHNQLPRRPVIMLNRPRNSGASAGPGVGSEGGPVVKLPDGSWPPRTPGDEPSDESRAWVFEGVIGVRLVGSVVVLEGPIRSVLTPRCDTNGSGELFGTAVKTYCN
jgi:hypothetical protein